MHSVCTYCGNLLNIKSPAGLIFKKYKSFPSSFPPVCSVVVCLFEHVSGLLFCLIEILAGALLSQLRINYQDFISTNILYDVINQYQ